jgi:uncharacterized membrane protein
MSARQLTVFVICFAVLSLAIALSLFSIGLWLVLPFAGLEILAGGGCHRLFNAPFGGLRMDHGHGHATFPY